MALSFPWTVLHYFMVALERAIAQLVEFTTTTAEKSALIGLPSGALHSLWMTVRPESSVGFVEGHSLHSPAVLYSQTQFQVEGLTGNFFRPTHKCYLPSLSRFLMCRPCDCFTLLTPVSDSINIGAILG